ncbi:uncharacterized protein LDX57_000502 [Aspergillus melleus]|uniref:uncharacterized protein n=1 Tax=Aspergillus melleus TaxID=138277 RepID=UPI001E8E55AC|nr:uncharacterized protein LDX57_000502 [Aspergillus melleus]KAH8422746.1 hypothetical protein LDX57_000502 [Aspergillus melleus]
MDLSTLEGPPILDHSPARDPPSMRLDALPSLGLPPRPASADALSRIYSLQSQPQSQSQPHTSSHSYSRSQSHLVPYPQAPLYPTSNPDSNLSPHYRRARTPSPTPISWASSSPGSASSSPNNNRPRRAPSPHRLIWLDAEKSWVILSEGQTSVYTPASHGCNCGGGSGGMSANMSATNLNAGMYPHSHSQPHGYGHSHPQPRSTRLPTMNINPAADLYPPPMVDAPPPYEHHVFDSPLVQVHGPGSGSRRRRGESFADSVSGSGSGSEGEPSRGRTGGSRWTAVARRLRASPVR